MGSVGLAGENWQRCGHQRSFDTRHCALELIASLYASVCPALPPSS